MSLIIDISDGPCYVRPHGRSFRCMHTPVSLLRWLVREVVLYIGASPLSYWHQLEELRALDDHLLRDIGICRMAANRRHERDVGDVLLAETSSLSVGA